VRQSIAKKHSGVSGTSVYVLAEHSAYKTTGFVFRTPLSKAGNWALALSWNRLHKTVSGIVVGLQENERLLLLRNVEDAFQDFCHQMMLPLCLCEMLADTNASNIRQSGHDLVNMEVRAALFDAYEPSSVRQVSEKLNLAPSSLVSMYSQPS
jgi:hypothetical protein